ncbi:MAG: tetratricopeptide repeat protein [Sphingobacteriales bacterium]|nr:tetratricopeptide repeat protein [Sphingobacteriales bacterium]
MRLQPDYKEAYNNRGLTLHALRRYPDAISDFDRAIALDPQYGKAYSNRR